MSQAREGTLPVPDQPKKQEWPLFYAETVRHIRSSIEAKKLAHVVRSVRGVGKTTVLGELFAERGGTFVQGRDPASAIELLREARQGEGDLYIDDADYLLDPRGEDAPRGPAMAADLEEVAADTVMRVTMRGAAVVVSYMYPDQRLDREYSLTISKLTQIGVRHRLPEPWTMAWANEVRKLLALRFGEMKDEARVLIAGTSVIFDDFFIDCWINEVIALTGGHPALVGSAMRSLAEDLAGAQPRGPLDGARPRVSSEDLSGRLRSWLELELTGEAVEAVSLRIAAVRKEPEAYEALVRAAQAGGENDLDLDVAKHVIPVLEHEGIAHYDRRLGKLVVRGTLVREALTKGMITLIPDPELPNERGRITLEVSGIVRQADFSGQAWRILRELHAAGGKRIATEVLAKQVHASSPGAVRALVQRIKSALDAADIRVVIGVERKHGYFLSAGRS